MVADRFSGPRIAPVMEQHHTPHPTTAPATRWPAAAYQHIADDGIGAEKLAASAVAPLVAAARGLRIRVTGRDSRTRPPGSGSAHSTAGPASSSSRSSGRTAR